MNSLRLFSRRDANMDISMPQSRSVSSRRLPHLPMRFYIGTMCFQNIGREELRPK